MSPAQAAKAAEVPVRRDPLASGFDRHCRKVRVRYEVPSRTDFQAQAAKQSPVACAGLHAHAVWRFAKLIGKGKRVGERARRIEDLGVRYDADECALHELGNPIRLVAIDHALEPGAESSVIRHVFPVRIDQDVDVGKDHLTTP